MLALFRLDKKPLASSELRWVTPDRAGRLLSYAHDRALVQSLLPDDGALCRSAATRVRNDAITHLVLRHALAHCRDQPSNFDASGEGARRFGLIEIADNQCVEEIDAEFFLDEFRCWSRLERRPPRRARPGCPAWVSTSA